MGLEIIKSDMSGYNPKILVGLSVWLDNSQAKLQQQKTYQVELMAAMSSTCSSSHKKSKSHQRQRPFQKSNPPHGSVEIVQILSTDDVKKNLLTLRAEDQLKLLIARFI
ncbi:MAG TPA: hypothetical protein VGQ39_18780 [Pyrinomonadaceae bacterium]|jgi:hypothetical protein|nr:hypothetical protein [Pyrinomonadaceae bacterium]